MFRFICVNVYSVMSDSLELVDCSPPGFSVHGIFQVRILQWVAMSYSRGSSWPRDQTYVSLVSWIDRWILYHCSTWEALFRFMKMLVAQSWPTLCDPMNCIAHQASLYIEFSRQEYWSGLPFLSPGWDRSSQPWDRTWVSCIADRFFTIWDTKETPI